MSLDEDRRRASADRPLVDFDALKPGDRIHYNSGWRQSSWSAEVRGTIDGEVVVIRSAHVDGRPGRHGARTRYALLDRFEVFAWSRPNDHEAPLRMGPIPKLDWSDDR